jgi:hypothetical protein
MTTNIQARDALVTEVLSQWAASSFAPVPIHWVGGPPPAIDTVSEFVYASVNFLAAEQASVETTPLTRVRGSLKLTFFRKEPNGDRRSQEQAEYLCDALAHRTLGGVQTATPTPMGLETHDGWYSTTWGVPFWFHK